MPVHRTVRPDHGIYYTGAYFRIVECSLLQQMSLQRGLCVVIRVRRAKRLDRKCAGLGEGLVCAQETMY